MTDNFDLLADWIRRKKTMDDDKFLFLQIIRRRKENPEAHAAQQTIKNLYLKSADDMMARREEIANWCHLHNARAYLRLNIRSKKKIALNTLAQIAETISNENYNIRRIHESVCGKYHSDPQKTWILDIDHDEPISQRKDLIPTIHQLHIEAGVDTEILHVPSKNGYSLVLRPFNVQRFNTLTGIHLTGKHNDNPVNLYIP